LHGAPGFGRRSRRSRVAGQGATEWDNLDYGPFLSASIEASAPAGNMTYKGVAVKLGRCENRWGDVQAAVCFDTQLMRLSAGWTGDFLRLPKRGVHGRSWPVPKVAGDVKFGTHNRPAGRKKMAHLSIRASL